MTCIVAVTDGETVTLGADQLGSNGWLANDRADGKIFHVAGNADVVIGFTSSYRMGQILQHHMRLVRPAKTVDPFGWVVRVVVEQSRKLLAEHGFRRKEHEVERGGTFIVGFRSRIFTVMDDFQVAEPADHFASTGSGQAFALGAMAFTSETTPAAIARVGLEAAERFCVSVRGPFAFIATVQGGHP